MEITLFSGHHDFEPEIEEIEQFHQFDDGGFIALDTDFAFLDLLARGRLSHQDLRQRPLRQRHLRCRIRALPLGKMVQYGILSSPISEADAFTNRFLP